MKRLRRCLLERKGSSYPLTLAIVLVMLLLMCGLAEFLRLGIIVSGVKEALQSAVISTVNDNYRNVYHGVREGYSGGYLAEDGGFVYAVDTGDIYWELDRVLGTSPAGEIHVKEVNGQEEYRLGELQVTIRNAPLAPSDPRVVQCFEADAALILEVPVRLAGKVFPPMRVRLKTQAGYTEVF